VHQALAVRAGRIVYVGDNAGAMSLTGKGTRVVDLQGRMLMPGLIDAHMHPQSGGSRLLNCSLDYQPLSVPQFQARIQACLERDTKAGLGAGTQRWLVVVNWFQQGMQPEGVAATKALLDTLKTARPIIVRSSFGHSALLNTRGLALAGIQARHARPRGGQNRARRRRRGDRPARRRRPGHRDALAAALDGGGEPGGLRRRAGRTAQAGHHQLPRRLDRPRDDDRVHHAAASAASSPRGPTSRC
jgi:predicted amidohydrolase YtcJ